MLPVELGGFIHHPRPTLSSITCRAMHHAFGTNLNDARPACDVLAGGFCTRKMTVIEQAPYAQSRHRVCHGGSSLKSIYSCGPAFDHSGRLSLLLYAGLLRAGEHCKGLAENA
jgi:hypothetical protein